MSRVITWVPISSERNQSRSLGTPVVMASFGVGVGVKRGPSAMDIQTIVAQGFRLSRSDCTAKTPIVQAASGKPTTWVWAPRAWVTPMVRWAAPIIGRRWLTTMNWAASA